KLRPEDAGLLAFFESRTNQTQIFREPGGRKLFHEFGRASQFHLEDNGKVTIGAESLEVQQRDAPQFFPRVADSLELFAAGGDCFVHAAIENGMENFFFALEVEVDGAVGNARLTCDIGDLRVEVTVVSEDANRRAQN